ncbi:MAG: hypothetical protein K8R85_07850 [Bacteroidetes bacterium]|nr:hypothetical protein [Bacteroidota bacterium]
MKLSQFIILISALFLLLLFWIAGCKKDPQIFPDGSVCEDFPMAPAGVGYQYQIRNPTLNRHAPSFNPNNSNEIALTIGDSLITAGDNLYTLNLNTGQKKYLVNYVWYQPKWSMEIALPSLHLVMKIIVLSGVPMGKKLFSEKWLVQHIIL